jgi:hypothetical protein
MKVIFLLRVALQALQKYHSSHYDNSVLFMLVCVVTWNVVIFFLVRLSFGFVEDMIGQVIISSVWDTWIPSPSTQGGIT